MKKIGVKVEYHHIIEVDDDFDIENADEWWEYADEGTKQDDYSAMLFEIPFEVEDVWDGRFADAEFARERLEHDRLIERAQARVRERNQAQAAASTPAP